MTSGSAGEVVERSGVSCFRWERDQVFPAYSAYGRGLDGLGSATSFLDLMPLGTSDGHARVRRHDEYKG